MKYETPLEAVKACYKFMNREYQNRLIICQSTLEAAKIAEYLTKYDVGEVVLNKFTQETHDEYIKEVCILHEQVNLDKPREEFEYFLSLYAASNIEPIESLKNINHIINMHLALEKARKGDNQTEPSSLDNIKSELEAINGMFEQFYHISFYEECCIAVLKPQYNYNDWCRDFEEEYHKIHPRN